MEVKIGIHESPKEIIIDVDGDLDELVKTIEESLSEDDGLLWLVDTKGRRVGVPSGKVAYVDISPDAERTVGFGR